MSEIYYTKSEQVIQNFISQYGVDELIKCLRNYSNIVSKLDYNMFHRIQRLTCEVYNIPIADIASSSSTNSEYADAKKIISYLTHRHTRLQSKHLTMLQSCTSRTIYNHIKEVGFRVEHPKGYKIFIEKLNLIKSKLENNGTTTTVGADSESQPSS